MCVHSSVLFQRSSGTETRAEPEVADLMSSHGGCFLTEVECITASVQYFADALKDIKWSKLIPIAPLQCPPQPGYAAMVRSNLHVKF